MTFGAIIENLQLDKIDLQAQCRKRFPIESGGVMWPEIES
jgi:hypothetical protein